MPSVTIATIRTALRTALAADLASDGLPDYSVAGLVLDGRYSRPPAGMPACIAIASPAYQSTPGPTLRQYRRTLVWDIMAWAPAAGLSGSARALKSEALLASLADTLDTARLTDSTLNSLPVYVVRGATLDADLADAPIVPAWCLLQVETAYNVVTGV